MVADTKRPPPETVAKFLQGYSPPPGVADELLRSDGRLRLCEDRVGVHFRWNHPARPFVTALRFCPSPAYLRVREPSRL